MYLINKKEMCLEHFKIFDIFKCQIFLTFLNVKYFDDVQSLVLAVLVRVAWNIGSVDSDMNTRMSDAWSTL